MTIFLCYGCLLFMAIRKLSAAYCMKDNEEAWSYHGSQNFMITPRDNVTRGITSQGKDYNLQQLHFHWGSQKHPGGEHKFNGYRFEMEIHLVHQSADNKTAVVGILVRLIKLQMNKATSFVLGVLLAPIIWMWIHIFVFHEPAWLISLVVYLLILVLLADETSDRKTTRMDREFQTERNRLKERSTQTDDFIGRTETETDSDGQRTISAIKSEEKEEVTEMASDVSEFRILFSTLYTDGHF
ncbi:hypothetical protein AVEN_99784-1 [Araneus ventricosus]|uniref:Alpha-carbonic anhydrase domain-containing protein n=1 Tax=Araneus ventricosus TaxID=182803 RepID=A0A4Y2RR48_ARAVE|nr:hypothetical protein AVEN_99784-1 [Araneus ventricosus]